MMQWQTLPRAQAAALGRMSKWKSAPSRFVLGFGDDGETLVVVPPSAKDRRRWDISKQGKIRKRDR